MDKAIACNTQMRKDESQLLSGRQKFAKACSNHDFAALALFYPYSDGVLDIEDYSKLPRCLEETIKAPLRIARIKLIFENVSTLKPAHVIGYLGQPELGVHEGSFGALTSDKERNLRVWYESKAFIKSLTKALTGKLPDSDPLDLLCNPA